LEINQKNVQECLARGLAVIEGDAEKDLINYPDNSFDTAILNQAIQQFYEPRKVLNELLRIAKKSNNYNSKFWLLESTFKSSFERNNACNKNITPFMV